MFRKLLLLLMVALLTACQTVNTTSSGRVGVNRAQYMFSGLSEKQVQTSAATAYQQEITKANQQGMLNQDKKLYARVKLIADRLISHTVTFRSDASSWAWEVNVQSNDQLNAYCMPGGKIMVYSGIIQKLTLSDDELAAVMGHEIAHALREHGRERMSEQMAEKVIVGVGAMALGLSEESTSLVGMVTNVTFGLPHSRTHETEADLMGLELMARAGYNPNAAANVWRKMGRVSKNNPPEFLSTHPSSSSRIRDLNLNVPKVMPLYQAAKKY
ncbi:MAG: M48 family peptidase [Nitrosomonadales bacterium]|jgi:predicted Zn-dependent protease|nr:MAG: M48 family peptidase [Nitrosomonadales bacterium]